jgi:hypothetical protein
VNKRNKGLKGKKGNDNVVYKIIRKDDFRINVEIKGKIPLLAGSIALIQKRVAV